MISRKNPDALTLMLPIIAAIGILAVTVYPERVARAEEKSTSDTMQNDETSNTSPGRPMVESIFSDMLILRNSSSARASSWDQSGANVDFRTIPPGETLELANIEGAGCIRHIYFTMIRSFSEPGDPGFLRDLVLRAYWDGETSPSIETPFGDFFGQGHGRIRFFRSLMVTVNEGAELLGNKASTLSVGFNSYFPMPFSDGARLTLTNEANQQMQAVWYHIDYEKMDHIDPDIGRFHAQWRRNNPTKAIGDAINTPLTGEKNPDGAENYVILDAKGHGNFVGYFLNVHNFFETWYGEGDDMIFIDGEAWPPAMHGTGTEECFGGGACPNIEYAGPYTGFHVIGNKNYLGKTSMYRFHVADPVRFQKSVKMTIEHGHANNFANDYSSTAFWYQAEPHAPFPALLSREERQPVAGDDPHDRAYAGFAKLLANRTRFFKHFQKKGIEAPKDVQEEIFTDIAAEIAKAFDAKDYATAAEKCQTANSKLESIIGTEEQP